MKMTKILTVSAAMLFICSCHALAADVIGEVQSTDIAALIDFKPIASYNINDRTYVIAEDLAGYGFDVKWNADERRLDISRGDYVDPSVSEKLLQERYVKRDQTGRKLYDVYATDIVTYLDGDAVDSSNVDGKTLIPLTALNKFGNVKYDNDDRIAYANIIVKDGNLTPTSGIGYDVLTEDIGNFNYYQYVYVGKFENGTITGPGYVAMIYDNRPAYYQRSVYRGGMWQDSSFICGDAYTLNVSDNTLVYTFVGNSL